MALSLPAFLTFKTIEQKQVGLMLATGFFMGVFIATYQVTADSIFLNRMGEYLDKAFLAAGLLGIISTSIFSYLQNFVRFSVLSQAIIVLILSFTGGVYYLLHFGDPELQQIVVFIMYCASGPIIALLLLVYWGTFGRIFNFKQSKRIIGWIDTGQLIAAITASFLIPLTGRLLPDTTDYLFVCGLSMLVLAILLSIISNKFPLAKNDPSEFDKDVRELTSIKNTFSDKYIILMSLFLFVSMTAFVFNQFAFQELVRVQYPNQRELTDFNAFFMAAVYAISLFMQTFINNRIIGNYGLRVSLMILPILLAILAVGSIVAGYSFGFDKELAPNGFIYFFLFVAMGRLFNWTLRESLETPVFKLFFIPLDGRLRFNIQSKVEGIVNESARFVAGLLIFSLAFLPFFEVIHISIFLALLTGAYFIVVNKLYHGYRSKIRLKLESTENQGDKLEKGFTRISERLEDMLKLPNSGKAVFSFKLLEKLNSNQLPTLVNTLIKNEDDLARNFAQDRLNEIKGLSVSDRYIIRVDKSKVSVSEKHLLTRNDLELMIANDGEITKKRIQQLSRSANPQDRQYAAELLMHTSMPEGLSFLTELLNDGDTVVRTTAIRSTVKNWNPEVLNALIENLGSPVFSNQAVSSLVMIGTKSLPYMDAAFYKSNQSTQVMLRLVQVIGRIGGQRAKDILWNKIDYPNKVVVSQVLLGLGECGFKAGISQVTRIKYAIEADIADIRWNYGAIQEIGELGFNKHIVKSLRFEIQNDIEHIYMLLAMLYDTRSIQLVKENIDSGTSEGIAYAVELLDVFLSDQLKQRVIPILDELTDAERIDKLDVFYPRTKLDYKLVLKFIINRDFTQSNRWTKACVLYQIGTQKIAEFKLDLIAHMFNPDKLIREVAAWALFQINEREYHDNVVRLGEQEKRALNDVIINTSRLSEFAEILFFQRIEMLKGIPGIVLSYLADLSDEIILEEGNSLILDDKVNNDFYVILSGKVELYQKGKLVAEYGKGQFVGEMIYGAGYINTNLIIAKEEVRLLKFNKDRFYDLLADDVKLTDRVLEFA
jgi:ATP:ADP antiporter, AAA family